MGLLGNLGKVFMGQPLGPAAPAPQSAPIAEQSDGIHDVDGRKIIPAIDIKNLKSYRQSGRLLVKAYIVNDSADQVIRVDTSYVVKQKRQHNQEITPGNSHELTLYDGPEIRDENEHTAQITYRLKRNGDVFREEYRIKYSLEPDGTRIIDELHGNGPIRDI